jgi:hypothetical protein
MKEQVRFQYKSRKGSDGTTKTSGQTYRLNPNITPWCCI